MLWNKENYPTIRIQFSYGFTFSYGGIYWGIGG
jgi:hypothetical protein